MARKLNIYALYKGENFIDMGNINELSKRLNIKKTTLYFYMTPAHKKRGDIHNHYSGYKVLVKVNDID